MSTTKNPAPVATGTDPGLYNPVIGPIGPLDTAPAPVPPGPGLGITATVPVIVPVVTVPTETVAAATASSFVPDTVTTNTVIRYLNVSDESVAINSQVTNLNFEGSGVSVANTANAINSVTVTVTSGGGSYGNSNVVTLLAGFGSNTLSTTGNVTGNYVLGNGSQLTGIATSYGNANVVANLAALGSNPVSSTGNISTTANVSGNYLLGNGSALTSLTGGNVTGTVANATYALTSNAATYSTQATSAGTANAVAGANVSGTVANATYALTSNAATYSTQATSIQAGTSFVRFGGDNGPIAFRALGNGGASMSGNTVVIEDIGVTINGFTSVTGNVIGGNILTSGLISTAGNITAANLGNIASINLNGNASTVLYGNGVFAAAAVSSSYGNANVVANLAALGSNPVSTTGNVTGGNLITAGLSTVTGNITGGNLITAGLISATGNVLTVGVVSATGNIVTAGNFVGNGAALSNVTVSVAGNIIGTQANVTLVAGSYSTVFDNTGVATFPGNIITTGNISATGSILAVPAWTSAGVITLTATTTNPTKGTTTSDNISYRQLGAKQWEVVMTYIQTVGSGGGGSGDYLVTLPNGLSFDTTLPSQQITTTNIGTNTYALMTYIIPSGSGLINNGTVGGQIYPIVYNATKFRILATAYGSAIQCWSSGYFSTGDVPKIQLTFRFTST